MYYGKLICGAIGFFSAGFGGLVIGLFVGHAFDKGLGLQMGLGSRQNFEEIQKSFFENTFLLLGYVAKSDGHVSKSEIEHTEQIFVRLGLNSEQRQVAIKLFQQGAAVDFDPESAVSQFRGLASNNVQLTQTLLTMLCTLALSDNKLDQGERKALYHIGRLLGLGDGNLDVLLRMVEAQARFEKEEGAFGSRITDSENLNDAYAILGVSSSTSDGALKKTYRKLMSQNHPDKLIAKGVPEDMVRLATEKTQSIQTAYEVIVKARRSKL